jgi:hypothetical protein
VSALNTLLGMHTASVETFNGRTATGDSYSSPVTIRGFLDDTMMLKPAPGGMQLVSNTSFYTDPANVSHFTPETRVTCNGQVMSVDSVRRLDGTGALGPVAHLKVDLS